MLSVVDYESSIVIKNSRFICSIYYLTLESDVHYYLDLIKKKYPDATHYCYAYIFDSVRRESDDGEPSGTAGIPILQVLEKNNLNHVLCIVVRYFGKIKLGAGGLVRAYTKSVTNCLTGHIITLKKGLLVSITLPYSSLKDIDYMLRDFKILDKRFDEDIIYRVLIDEDCYNYLKKYSNIKVNILENTFIPIHL